jgi:hypothetical protein
MIKDDDNPMQKAHVAPKCTAHSKRTGEPCQAPAVTGWRVGRLLGAGGGHPAGKVHPSWRHGQRSRAWTKLRHEVNELIQKFQKIKQMINTLTTD